MNTDAEPVLSAAETSALLDAMNESEVAGPPVEPIDLSSPERRVRGKLLAADKAGEAISVELGKAMLRHTEALSRVEIAPAELVPFGMLVTIAMLIIDPEHRTLHDRVAKTLVA